MVYTDSYGFVIYSLYGSNLIVPSTIQPLESIIDEVVNGKYFSSIVYKFWNKMSTVQALQLPLNPHLDICLDISNVSLLYYIIRFQI